MQQTRKRIAVIDSRGRETYVEEVQRFKKYSTLSDGTSVVPGLIEYFDATGKDCNLISDTQFQVVVTDEMLTRI